MRSPSSRVLINRVDLYVGANARDPDGGFTQINTLIPTSSDMACSVQYTGTQETIDAQNRITNQNVYMIMFGQPVVLTPRDLIVWNDGTTQRMLFTQGVPPSEAGRGGAFTIRAVERI